jgi:6-pyruvoyltetrahydropterin/6-carboxytetrahydropterin synthase
MYEITVETVFSSAHFLKNYEGKCEKLHGHNWKVRITVSAADLDEKGLAMDFKTLKEIVNKFVEKFDHANLNELPEFRDNNPTTENIARIIFEGLEKIINGELVSIKRVSVGETENSWASYWK